MKNQDFSNPHNENKILEYANSYELPYFQRKFRKMKPNYKYLFFVTLVFGMLFFMITGFMLTGVIADLSDIQYPIADLGNCGSEEECEAYCEIAENIESCLNFAEKNNLMSQSEIDEARKVAPFLARGETPGGCKTKDECMTYCDNPDNFNVCIKFAEDAGFVSPEEAEIARLTGGVGPGGCKRDECRTYCEDPDNFELCLQFAEEKGLVGKAISREEYEMAKKIIPIMKAGKMPGNCKSKEECETYCDKEENFPVCIDFAVKAGFISEKDAEMARKTGGKGPGGCRSEESCKAYCENNLDECSQFALEYGLVSEEEAEAIKKYGTSGPGGCRSKEECEAYCQNPDNQDECRKFAGERGLDGEGYGTSPEIASQIPSVCLERNLGEQECRALCENDPAACGRSIDSGEEEEYEEFGGPGGCKTPEECEAYCRENPSECGGGELGSSSPSGESEEHPIYEKQRVPPSEYEAVPPEAYQRSPTTGYVIMRVVR